MSPMPATLEGCEVLVVEDDYYQATDLKRALEAAGAIVMGPFGDEDVALRALEQRRPDCGLIDFNLGHGQSLGVPRLLTRLNVPFAIVTGYDAKSIPEEFVRIPPH